MLRLVRLAAIAVALGTLSLISLLSDFLLLPECAAPNCVIEIDVFGTYIDFSRTYFVAFFASTLTITIGVVILLVSKWTRLGQPKVRSCQRCGFSNPPFAKSFCVKCGSHLDRPFHDQVKFFEW